MFIFVKGLNLSCSTVRGTCLINCFLINLANGSVVGFC